jgi:hypothetical protein
VADAGDGLLEAVRAGQRGTLVVRRALVSSRSDAGGGRARGFTKLNIRSRNALDQALTTESSPAPAR